MKNGEFQEISKNPPLSNMLKFGYKPAFQNLNILTAKLMTGFITNQKLTISFQEQLKKKLKQKLDNWLGSRIEILLDSDCYCGGNMDWEEAEERAIEELKENFDQIDEQSELIEVCKEDEPELWAYQKDIFNQLIDV